MVNPILHYKLDPGEFGIPFPARASESAIRVASQELGNLNRFRMKALREGGRIIYSKITFHPDFKGGFMAITSGKTEVRVVHSEKGKEDEPIPSDVKENQEENNPLLSEEKTPSATDNIGAPEDDKKNTEMSDKLQIAERILKRKLDRITLEKTKIRSDHTLDAGEKKEKLEHLEREEKEVKNKLKDIETNIVNLSLQKARAVPLPDISKTPHNSIDTSMFLSAGFFEKGLVVDALV